MTAPIPALVVVCGVSGCGSLEVFLDTSTERTAAWVQVRIGGRPRADTRWYCTTACAAAALGGDPAEAGRGVRERLVVEIDAAAVGLGALFPGDLVMLARRHGLETARRIVSPDRPGDGVPRCCVCGCTEDDPCAGGCAWVPDATGMREACSNCAPRDGDRTCLAPGCGTSAGTGAGVGR